MFSKGSFVAFCLLKHLGLLLPGGRWFSFLAPAFNLALPFRHCFCLCTVWKEFVTPMSVISQTGSLVTRSPKAWGSTAVLWLFFCTLPEVKTKSVLKCYVSMHQCFPCFNKICWLDQMRAHCLYLGVILVPVTSVLQASESGRWLINPLCTLHSCSSALWQFLTSFQNSPDGDLQSWKNDSTSLARPVCHCPHQCWIQHCNEGCFKFQFSFYRLCLKYQSRWNQQKWIMMSWMHVYNGRN